MKISEIITDKYKLRIPPTVYYELLADVREVEEDQEPTTKNDLGVDWESYKDADGNSLDYLILNVLQNSFDCGDAYGYTIADKIIGLLPSVTPQERTDKNFTIINDLEELRTMINKFAESYEDRLKADMVAMLTEIQLEIEESENCGKAFHLGLQMASNIIQQKINALKAETEDQNGQTSN